MIQKLENDKNFFENRLALEDTFDKKKEFDYQGAFRPGAYQNLDLTPTLSGFLAEVYK